MLASKLKKVAVTGVLSAGKSTVCRLFKELGAYVVSADEIVHQLLSSSTALSQQVIHLFGADIVVDGQIDRSLIANKAFQQSALLQSLENILHPAVRDEIEKQYVSAAASGHYALFVAEVPLLFETGADCCYAATVTVAADRKHCLERFRRSNGGDHVSYDQRMARQLSAVEKASKATYVIVNDGDSEALKTKVKTIFSDLTKAQFNPKDRSLKL